MKPNTKKILALAILLTLIFLSFGIFKTFNNKNKITGLAYIGEKYNLPQNNIGSEIGKDFSGSGQYNEVLPSDTGSLSSGVNLKDIVGSYKLIIMAGKLVGGVIVSSKEDNAVTAFNPLTGDVVVYNMGLGDTVTIDYTSEPAYQAKMSEGVEAEIQANNKVRFTAYGDDSVLKIKPSEEPSYEFNNGLLEYENERILEQINTTKINEANVDSNYAYGFKCLTLATDANYNYQDKIKEDKGFGIQNLNKQDYQICVKKTIYDEYSLSGQRYSLIDLVKDKVDLKAKVIFSKQSQAVYESLDSMNEAEIETSMGTTKLTISNKAPSTETVSKTYIGNHVITEKLEKGKVIRFHEFSDKKSPEFINVYSTTFNSGQPDITIENNMLVQEGNNKFTALTQENSKCLEQVKSLMNYEEDEAFYEEC